MTSTAKTSTLWIGPDETLRVGDVGFMVRHANAMKGWVRIEIRDTPAHTNQSHQPRLSGWCGTTNDVATYADGMARVERVAKNGRALVRRLESDDLAAALEELGYPELS